MANLSMEDVVRLARAHGVPDDQLATAAAIATAESGRTTDAVGTNGPTEGCPDGSRDLGLWQINDCYHADLAGGGNLFDPDYNAQAMVEVSNGGVSWSPWSTFNGGEYQAHLGEAQLAVQAVLGGSPPLPVPPPSPSPSPPQEDFSVSQFTYVVDQLHKLAAATGVTLDPIPGGSGRTYTIQRGDTLSGIASAYSAGTWTWEQLFADNQAVLDQAAHDRGYASSDGGNLIFPGTVITLPD